MSFPVIELYRISARFQFRFSSLLCILTDSNRYFKILRVKEILDYEQREGIPV